MVPRAVVTSDDETLEKLTKNITRQGLTNFTMNYLRVSAFITFQYVINFLRERLYIVGQNWTSGLLQIKLKHVREILLFLEYRPAT